ncbi:MAG TPA: GNAT family N-acetyltransferase [Pyrinomonadaceae bacterium]|jgi:predicted acetyltransferase|nr:GNAT family N-acetyltransferase [Pyrinomonadaceae bacterium]
MGNSQATPPAEVEVIRAAPEQEPILANLFELYSHDFSEFVELELGPDGRFGYSQLSSYWTDADRHPFLVRVGGRWAGFVLVRKGSEISGDAGVWDVAEFFIVRGRRRLGVGTRAAHEIWRMFPGRWEVRVMDRNRKAQEFWERAVGEFLGGAAESTALDRGGKGWRVFSFESGRSA